MKNKIIILVLLISLILISGCGKNKNDSKYTIVTTSFPGFDFARAITEETDFNVIMLIKPGSEMHHYEPTPQDIINIEKSDLFIYVGGDSDSWIEDVLKDIDTKKTKIIKLMDLVNVVEEETVEGMEEEKEKEEIEYDEHIWTSPSNVIAIIEKLKEEIIKIDENDKEKYEKNSSLYINKIKDIDEEIKEIVNNSKRKELVFADRFPFRYFVDEYNLDYYAAFKGCSEQTEASAKTIAFLIDKVKKDNIPVVFKIELSDGKIAENISKATQAKILEFHSAHNISQKDFDKGLTYIDIMKNNVKALKEALN